MPREERRIYFDRQEMAEAIAYLCEQKDLPKPPHGPVLSMNPNPANPHELEIVIENQKTGVAKKFHYTHDFIIAAMMTRCRSANIPLPREAGKSMEVSADHAVLSVQMTH